MVPRASVSLRAASLLAASLLAALRPGSVDAATPPVIVRGRPVPVHTTAEMALVISQDGWEHLVVQPAYAAADTTRTRLPRVAFVIAVVDAPTHAAIGPDSLMADAWRWLDAIAAQGEPGDLPGRAEASDEAPAPVLPPAVAGRYEAAIIPPSGRADRVLDAWLSEKGFGELPAAAVEACASAGAAFVVMAVTPDAEQTDLPARGALRPLIVSFRSDRITYLTRLSVGSGAFPIFLLVAAARPINVSDAEAYGFVPLEAEACRERLDRVLWEAKAPEERRAAAWYGAPIAASDRWLRERTVAWRAAPVNRLTAFRRPADSVAGELAVLLRAAASENEGNAPASVTAFYDAVVRGVGGSARDSVFVSALCAPALNTPGTDADLDRWRSDPVIRLRDQLTSLAPLADAPVRTVADSAYRPPRPGLLPLSEALSAAFSALLAANTPAELEAQAMKVLQEERALVRVRLPRELRRVRQLDALVGEAGATGTLHWPADDTLRASSRSMAAFERAFRRMAVPLEAVWAAAQHTSSSPARVLAAIRLHVTAAGVVEVLDAKGNVPPGPPMELLRHVVATGVRLGPASTDGTWDFFLAIED